MITYIPVTTTLHSKLHQHQQDTIPEWFGYFMIAFIIVIIFLANKWAKN